LLGLETGFQAPKSINLESVLLILDGLRDI
jgi:hypothetical protein